MTWFRGLRLLNQEPACGPSRVVQWDYPHAVRSHPTYDAFWRERTAAENLHKIRVPVFSIGVWRKVDLHLNGNIVGYQRSGGPKKMLVFGSANLHAAVQDYSSIAFHEKYLLPFYDRYLKGKETSYEAEPAVRWFASGANELRTANDWPPEDINYKTYYLAKSGREGSAASVTSLNDGALDERAPKADSQSTAYDYPDPGWRMGVVGTGPDGRPDPARRVLTFTSAPLEDGLEIAGPIKLVVYAASTQTDTDFIIKLSEQYAQSREERAKDINPRYQIVTKGWLRASHRRIDAKLSTEHAPHYLHQRPEPITPGKVYRYEIAVMPTAHRFARGSRIRLEIANGDSSVTEQVFAHEYSPAKIGRDTIFHDRRHPSQLALPVRR